MKVSYLSKIFHYIALTSVNYNIDESHSILHSMNTLIHASNMLREETITRPELKNQTRIIHTAALLHDMIDRKYVETIYTNCPSQFDPIE